MPFGEWLLPLFCAFAAVVTGGAGSGAGVAAGAAALPFPFPLPFTLLCAPAVSAALVLVGAAASGVTGALGAGEALCAPVVVVESPLLVGVVVAGSLVVLVAAAFPLPLPLPLSARASAGDTRKAAKARMQIESARSALWVRVGSVDVSHVGVLTAPDRSPFKPSRKSSPFASLPREGEC